MLGSALEIGVACATAASWISGLIDLRHALAIGRLPPARALDLSRRPMPTVTVVVPARDEALRIEGTVRRLLEQRDVVLDVVVVDDRSSDTTARIVERLAGTDARVHLLRIEALPPGWIGKCHALERGGEAARGEWMLFTDGDAWIEGDVIARAIAAAEREHADHVAVAPHQLGGTLCGQAGLAAFSVGLTGYMSRAHRGVKGGHVGIGAFNLVRAAAWRAIGGHSKLALEVVDDLKLGLLLERGGFRTKAYVGPDALHVEWSRTLFGIVKALEKNLFAVLRYDVRIAAGVVLFVTTAYALVIAGIVVGGTTRWMACSCLIARALPALVIAHKHGSSILAALLSPIAGSILVVATVNSTWKTLRAGGVRWRDTFYPLAELRRGRVR